jgi:Mrp family chromosome partitioning ATPase
MTLSESYKFLQEVFQWDAGRLAALATGAVLTLGVLWLVWSWLPFSSKRLRAVVDELLPRMQKDREEALMVQQRLQTENEKSQRQLSEEARARKVEREKFKSEIEALSSECEGLKEDADALEQSEQVVEAQLETFRAKSIQNRDEIATLESQVEDLTRQIQAIVNSDGRIWEKPVSKKICGPVFRGNRQTPIISVVNLKGGVGKTTIAASINGVSTNSPTRAAVAG